MPLPNNKLFSILSRFSKIELNRFKKYLLSPYFNKNETLIQLFYQIEKRLLSKKEVNYDKEKIWTIILGKEKYDDVRFRKFNSDLLKLVEGFLAQEIYERNPLHQASYLIEAVGDKKLDKLYNSTMSTARRLSERQLYKPATYYFYQYLIERNYYELTDFDLNRGSVTNVDKIINNLDYFYLAEKLRYYCETLSRRNVISYEYEIIFIDEIVQHIKQYGYDDLPPVAIYYQMFLTQTDPENEEHYYKLKDLLNKHWQMFPIEETKSMYTNCINYCIKKINVGNLNFHDEFLNINENLLERGIIGQGELSPWRFKNIITVALKRGNYNWTAEFIHNYISKIPDSYRENALSFNLAQLYFYQKNYDKVIEMLRNVEYEDFTYNLNSKQYLLRTYYEIDEIEPLYSLLDSFRVYLKRNNKLANDRKKRYLNLISFTKRLTKVMPGENKVLEKIKFDLSNINGVVNEKWLREKIAELEERI